MTRGEPSEYDGTDQFLTPKQVAALFHVTPKTATRWARPGKIGATTTVGGHHRFRANEIYALLRAMQSIGHVIGKARAQPPIRR
ncbi:helix-turn-helix domain-containing protein [Rhodococcus qingshengii]|uniref:helix-turn-helix domain-containing protein n=1 Tax=Rhodococcus qingshengii TaxID=334542 RepID=UPI0024B9C091|nr:helix-turn-helix domain-containing protein [Rhodococcus qingshengii]MDJ0441415.1 helix-turn-helix domain-containing protein [Rhodococcus qingshengii]